MTAVRWNSSPTLALSVSPRAISKLAAEYCVSRLVLIWSRIAFWSSSSPTGTRRRKSKVSAPTVRNC